MNTHLNDHICAYITGAFKDTLDAIKPTIELIRASNPGSEKIKKYDTLVQCCDWCASLTAVYICLRYAPKLDWIEEEMAALLTKENASMMAEWEAILDASMMAIGDRPDHPQKNSFNANMAAFVLAKSITYEVRDKIKKEKGKSGQAQQLDFG